MTYMLTQLGAYEEAERCASETLDHETSAQAVYTALENLGLVRLKRGLLDEAQSLLSRACEGYTAIGRFHQLPYALAYLAQVALAKGDVGLAGEHIQRALSHCDDGSPSEALALSVSAKVDLRRGDHAQACRSAERALATVKNRGAFEHQALIRATHADSLIACARIEEGRAAIAEASSWLASELPRRFRTPPFATPLRRTSRRTRAS